MTISSPDVTVLKTDHITHFKCGGTITPEMASAGWRATTQHDGKRITAVLPSSEQIEIGRCDKCGLAGIVCEPPS